MLRGYGLLRDVLEGIMVEKKRTDKPREGMTSDIEEAVSNLKIKKEISDPKDGNVIKRKKKRKRSVGVKRKKRVRERREKRIRQKEKKGK